MNFIYKVRAALVLLGILFDTLLLILPLYLFTLFKILFPVSAIRRPVNYCIVLIAELWTGMNSFWIRHISRVELDVSGDEGLKYKEWYLITSNHQSWADILIMQMVLNRRIPSLKFFIKQELIKVPLLGLAWWALDFPFMKRYSKEELAKHPELKGKDLETTRRACAKFMHQPTAIVNFFEGTRFTPAKHDKQQSPYRHLLKPKSGGTAFALNVMQGKLSVLLNLTLIYSTNQPVNIMAFLGGRINKITFIIDQQAVPDWAATGDYQNDPDFRAQFQQWVSDLWVQKDALLEDNKSSF